MTRPYRSTNSVTVHDVARVADVSAITVSRALNNPDQLSASTLARVLKAIEETGYVPNLLAKGLNANKSTRLVAALIPTLSGPIFSETIQALTQKLTEHGYQLILGQSGYDGDSQEDALLNALIGRRPDGIVLTGVLHSQLGCKRLKASGIPIVETWDLSDNPIDMLVGFSHEQVGAKVCEFLHQRGRQRPGLLAAEDARAQRRSDAFIHRAAELGMGPVRLIALPAPTTLAIGRVGLNELLTAHPDVDSVFCSSDMLALGVLTEAQARGLKVPEELSVVGFGDLDFAASLYPALTTVRIDGKAIGEQAARFIIARADGVHSERHIVDIGFSIMERDSS
ncbi:LacI family DNA-binding transcriptional regulator [Candidimonas sp. SYP-B2681]|uniref:LacI family DNA-binding transcriptional regulator n=1 Tax=Candidimonas sp. SYP-B2681 TaxID=2497686 RepID=UPI000F893D97|nr:LacI family DNA-binding transcriptional regulator [Candidimonas sp. SYP-B2681]RTZ40004.1 LacI family DNA-binding transcriptional regulator [Candidimonas sp. SYP-B2681]